MRRSIILNTEISLHPSFLFPISLTILRINFSNLEKIHLEGGVTLCQKMILY